MKVVVTGGGGFIGVHLISRLLAEKHEVEVFDGDVCDLYQVSRIPMCDVIFHLAAISDVRDAEKDPELAFRVNVLGTKNVAVHALNTGVGKFVFTSSSSVYGEHALPCVETDDCRPVSYYGVSKLQAEQVLGMLAQRGLRTCCVRLGNTIGPGSVAGVIPEVLARAREHDVVGVYGDGRQQRSYLYIDDTLDGLMQLATETWWLWLLVNMGGDPTLTVAELISIIIPGRQIEYIDSGMEGRGWLGDIRREWMNSEVFKGMGWCPQYNSYEAVRKTVEEIRRQHEQD